MASALSYQNVSIPTLDAIITNLLSQHVPVSKMAGLYNEVRFWQNVRRAKLAEQGARS